MRCEVVGIEVDQERRSGFTLNNLVSTKVFCKGSTPVMRIDCGGTKAEAVRPPKESIQQSRTNMMVDKTQMYYQSW